MSALKSALSQVVLITYIRHEGSLGCDALSLGKPRRKQDPLLANPRYLTPKSLYTKITLNLDYYGWYLTYQPHPSTQIPRRSRINYFHIQERDPRGVIIKQTCPV